MAVCRIVEVSGRSLEDYERVGQQLGDEPPDGALVHIAGATGDGFHVIEVWQSAEQMERWSAEKLRPALAAAGLTDEPTVTHFDVHNLEVTPAANTAVPPG